MGCLVWAYQIFCLQLFLSYFHSSATLCSHDQRSALLQFKQLFSFENTSSIGCYSDLSGLIQEPNPKMLSWKEDTDCCSWDGVTCDMVTGHVIGLDLSCSRLRGNIPSNSTLFLLPYLQTLNLGFNDFNYSLITSGFGKFPRLTHLNLSSSEFSGQLPAEISQLSKLVSLDLSRSLNVRLEMPVWKGIVENLTELRELVLDSVDMSTIETGSFANLTSSLSSLSLKGCGLQGNFPENIFHLPNLQKLKLSYNENLISRVFPKVNWSIPIRVLGLDDCNLIGSIPASLGNLIELTSLHLSVNNLVGEIPDTFVNLTQLSQLDISRNKLTGPLPYCLSRLQSLTNLYLFDNSFSGIIPSWLFTLRSLEKIALNDNQLSGSIPSSIFELVNLTLIGLSSNNFSGNVELYMFSKLKNLYYLSLSGVSLSLNTTLAVNSSFSNLRYLYLSGCNISEFPNILRTQHQLISLDLSKNKIHGRIPSWLWDIGKDTLSFLNLSHNSLTDVEQVPWRNLEILDLSSNMLEGSLMVLPPRLTFFSVSNNKLTGEIPSSFWNFSYIYVLDLSNNSLSGLIPKFIGNSSTLRYLDLQLNNFHGNIPQNFANDSSLIALNLNGNQLEGRLPQSLVRCRYLRVLDVGNNMINDTFPHWLAQLPALQALILRSNKFHGLIGNTNARVVFPKLQILDISRNEFTGVLPTTYFQKFEAMMHGNNKSVKADYMRDYVGGYYSVFLTVKGFDREMYILNIFMAIDLSSNRFEGQIPEVVGKLNSLEWLNFSHNKLTGRIPSTLRNLTALESLDLSSNRLVGQIPTQLTNLNFLSTLNLSYNQLEGPIPLGSQFNTFSNDSYIGNLGLCGTPLSEKCSNEDDQEPTPTNLDEEDDNWSWFEWEAVKMGYGSGLVIGLSIGYMVFATGRPRFLVRKIQRKQYKGIRRRSRRGRVPIN